MRARAHRNKQDRARRSKQAETRAPKPRASRHLAFGGAQGVADSIRGILTYSDVISLSPASQIAQYTFRGNSCYAPDYTNALYSHQPQYYDQMTTLYSRYRVYGSKIQIAAVNEQVGSSLQVSIIPASDITAFTTSTYPLEHPYAKPLPLLGVGGLITASKNHSMSTMQILGLRPREILDQDYSALTGANPSSIWYWQIVAQNLSAENVLCSMRVIITYDVEFYDRQTATPSLIVDPEKVPPEGRLASAFGPAALAKMAVMRAPSQAAQK